ncbi:MAG TPA: YchF/TatD family DNA exonuclease [Psychromonas hadalis]|nr:YchF/TatD family DNA exonuclease [Psychromonas hadalis]
MLIDSHCHLDGLDYVKRHKDVADVLRKAKENNVHYLLSIGVKLDSYPAMKALTQPFANIFRSVGVHPLYQDVPVDEALLLEYATDEKVIAIGETGLDFFYSPENKKEQEASFRSQIRIAKQVNKPLIIHTRDARQLTLDILREEGAEQVGGVLHCFTESLDMAVDAMKMGFYISVSGIVTFKNAKALQEVIRHIPLDRLLVETDSPYLAPIPHRGEQNEPAYVKDVAQFVANLKQVSLKELEDATTKNFFKLFSGAKR